MIRPHPNDISIGKDRWITFIDVDGRQGDAVDIDPVLEPIQNLLKLLETECVTACCGIDALGLWAEDIAHAKKESVDPAISEKVLAVRNQVAQTDATLLVSHRLNNFFDRQVLLELLDHISACLSDCAEAELSTVPLA